MVQAVKLTFDGSADDRVRAEWSALQDAAMPTLADHTGATNRPHVTVHVRDGFAEVAEQRLAVGGGGSPLTLPGRWVPHVTLARGVRADQLPAVLERHPPYAATAARLRRWDQTTRRAWDVGQTSAGRSL